LNIVLEELKKKFPKEGDVVRARLHEMAVI
jgi:hypothetical protein